jgi:ATP-binding cassette, subfamily F, member 2
MESIDALALAIKEFEGGVVIVSHDFRPCIYSQRYAT